LSRNGEIPDSDWESLTEKQRRLDEVRDFTLSRQVGLKPKAEAQGAPNGNQSGGEIFLFDNQKIVAAVIPWVQPDETPLRTTALRAAETWAVALPANVFWTKSPLTWASIRYSSVSAT
jgi:hypothetical protein